MTAKDPTILCPACMQFDYDMNRQDGISMDVLVVCDHDVPTDEKGEMQKWMIVASKSNKCGLGFPIGHILCRDGDIDRVIRENNIKDPIVKEYLEH